MKTKIKNGYRNSQGGAYLLAEAHGSYSLVNGKLSLGEMSMAQLSHNLIFHFYCHPLSFLYHEALSVFGTPCFSLL